MMRTMETRTGIKVNTPFTDMEAISVLRGHVDKLDDFGRKLANGQKLSPEMIIWAHIKAVSFLERETVKTANVELKAILTLLTGARSGKLQNPSITFEWNGRTVELSLAGARAKRPGTINVTDGAPYGQNVWYGRINLSGVFEPGPRCDSNVMGILVEFNENPAKYAAEYGRKTGRCCFCNLALTDVRSTAVGYGPTCAKHYHLPWGAAVAADVLEAQIAETAAVA